MPATMFLARLGFSAIMAIIVFPFFRIVFLKSLGLVLYHILKIKSILTQA